MALDSTVALPPPGVVWLHDEGHLRNVEGGELALRRKRIDIDDRRDERFISMVTPAKDGIETPVIVAEGMEYSMRP